MRRLTAAAGVLLAVPAVALAAAPANDSPSAPAQFEAFTAGNSGGEEAAEKQAIVDLTEATADKGVARCLGPKSFAKTVWFAIPAADAPQLVRVEASSPTIGGTAEVPDLALFIAGQTKVANACDGPAAGARSTSAAAVEARLPAGTSALVQIGRTAGQAEQKVTASLATVPVNASGGKAPAGDVATRAPALAVGPAKPVPLAGATLTGEDPAQPACPAAATVWRRTKVKRAGRYRVVARGAAAGSLTAFVGRKPTASSVRACVNRRTPTSALPLKLRLKRGAVLWTRIGVDAPSAGDKAKLRVKRLK